MSAEELRAVRARWRGKADRRASEEDQRFQVVVAAVMSSRAQGTVVSLNSGHERFLDHNISYLRWPLQVVSRGR